MVLDASAIVKLIINESESDFVRKKVVSEAKKSEPIYTPDIALAESLNVIWKYSSLKSQNNINQYKVLSDLMLLWNTLTVVNTATLASLAMKIAVDNKITIYDALYAALSKLENAPLLTFDKYLKSKATDIEIKVVTI